MWKQTSVNIIQYKTQCLTYANDGVVVGLAVKYIAETAEDMTQHYWLVWPQMLPQSNTWLTEKWWCSRRNWNEQTDICKCRNL